MKKKAACKAERPTLLGQISRSLSLPSEVLEGMPEIELRGNKEAVIEHCLGILEYNDHIVRLDTGKLRLSFVGRNMQLCRMTGESAVVTGYITQITFEV